MRDRMLLEIYNTHFLEFLLFDFCVLILMRHVLCFDFVNKPKDHNNVQPAGGAQNPVFPFGQRAIMLILFRMNLLLMSG